MNPFGHLLQKLRMAKGLQQTQIALGAGISSGYYSLIESGKKPPPSKDVLNKIAAELRLEEHEIPEFWLAVKRSRQNYCVPPNANLHEYELISLIWEQLGSITQDQALGMQLFLKMNEKRR